jgi:hypothetical protein
MMHHFYYLRQKQTHTCKTLTYKFGIENIKRKYIIIIIIIIIINAIEFSLGGSSPYKSSKYKQIYINETTEKHSTENTKHSQYKYTYYQNTHTAKTPISTFSILLRGAYHAFYFPSLSSFYYGNTTNSDRLIFHDHRIELTSKTLGTLTVHGNAVAKDLNPRNIACQQCPAQCAFRICILNGRPEVI